MTDRGRLILACVNFLSIAISTTAIIVSTRAVRKTNKVCEDIEKSKRERENSNTPAE